MQADFSGLHVLVTRPGDAGAELCALIEKNGGKALHFPVIDFAPPVDIDAFHAAVSELGNQDIIIFNSPQAVTRTVPAMRAAWPHFPPEIQFATVGAGTASALRAAGYNAALHPEKDWNSEGLLAMPVMQSVKGKKIAVVRGQGGRELLEKILSERGAQVVSCIAYQRVLPVVNAQSCLDLINQKMFDLIIAGSFETVGNLTLLLGSDCWPLLKNIPLIVLSERVKKLAAESGFRTIWVAPTASQQAILDLISQQKEVLCQTIKKS
jgi:uroporphyrinogen-III synthase